MRISCQLTKHFAQLRRVPRCDLTDKQKWHTGLSSRLTSPVCLPPATLHLCRGALVILLRNLDPERGLCNGARAILVRASTPFLEGRRVFIPRIPMTPTEWTLPVKLVRRQFPIRLAWAMTIHKSQGQTLERTLSFFGAFWSSPSHPLLVLRMRSSFYIALSATLRRRWQLVGGNIHTRPPRKRKSTHARTNVHVQWHEIHSADAQSATPRRSFAARVV